jgi:hypothetical protein
MSSIPVIVGGAAKEAKPSVIIGSAEKKIYDGYVMVGGVAKRLYKAGYEWTYKFSNPNDYHCHCEISNGANYSISMELPDISRRTYLAWGSVDLDYIFTEPLFLKKGSILRTQGQQYSQGVDWDVIVKAYFNGQETEWWGGYSVPEDICLSEIRFYCNLSERWNWPGHKDDLGWLHWEGKFIIQPLGEEPFFLNNTGSSAN